MKSPYSNPYLSARAKGIFAYYNELGRPVSADEMSAVMPEGRDALQSAINELRKAGYIRTTREWNGRKWISVMKFTDEAKKSKVLNPGFSGLYNSSTTNSQSTISEYNIDNTIELLPVLELLRNSNTSRTASSKEESVEMPWNLDGEETPKKRSQIDDDASGAVGKVEDKAAMRKAKYGGKAFTTAPLAHRSHKPEEEWSTKDLVSEFASLLNDGPAGHLTMQLNTQHLAIWINQTVGKGATRPQILAAMREFFDDPRTLNNAGTGVPIWRRFIAFYQTVEGKVLEQEIVYMTEQDLAHQEKMLKLLGGK